MDWLIELCFAGVDLFVLAPLTRYLPERVVWEGASDEAVGAVREQVFTWAAGTTGTKDARWRPSWPGMIYFKLLMHFICWK